MAFTAVPNTPSSPPCGPKSFWHDPRRLFGQPLRESGAVIADRFHGATLHRFLAKLFFLRSGGLFKNVRIAAIIVAAKVTRGGFTAKVAVDTLVIDVKFAGKVFGIAVCDVSHNLLEKQAYTGPMEVQYFFCCFYVGRDKVACV
jgi:hypothetical protein